MADKKISELTSITGADVDDANDTIAIVDSSEGQTKKITRGELFTNVGLTGDVTGDLTGDVTGNLTGDVTGDLTGDVTGNLTGDVTGELDLTAIDTTKAETAVDVFVYDTSKDSDGGAWRKRTQHTSWYNETLNTATRGSRREFPAVAVIVATASGLTIYDGDDPALPMWMVFNLGRLLDNVNGGIAMLNGELAVGTNATYGSVRRANFVSDTALAHRAIGSSNGTQGLYNGTISTRNASGVVYNDLALFAGRIVQETVNDVAMTVLPNAPIDPATGLPVPTIAVATAGGVSVIKDDGNVWDITFSGGWGNNITQIQAANENIYFQNSIYYWLKIPIKDVDQDRVVGNYPFDATAPFVQMQPNGTTFSSASGAALENSDIELAYSQGNSRTGIVAMTQNAAMRFDVTSKFNTGWMNGDIKGAFLSDTDTASLVGATVENSEFTGTGVTDGWTIEATATNNNGVDQLDVTTGAASNVVANKTLTGLTAGAWYKVQMTRVSTGSSSAIFAGASGSTYGTSGVADFTFKATATTQSLQIRAGGALENIIVDNISVKLADADRSVNNNGLIVNGTVTRNPVATGAELVAYSGFSASNYLEQPYNSDLDFGTGDYCYMGWVQPNSDGANANMVSRQDPTDLGLGTGYYITLGAHSNADDFRLRFGSDNLYSGVASKAGVWSFLCATRKDGVVYFYVDGVLTGSAANTDNVDNTSAKLFLGSIYWNESFTDFNGKIALVRVSATAPTAEQVAKIYNDEKVLFQESAAATLYGTSDAVTALAHDSDTGLLHVGTSAGRSVFQGLRRVSNTTTAVGTAISASNGLVVEE